MLSKQVLASLPGGYRIAMLRFSARSPGLSLISRSCMATSSRSPQRNTSGSMETRNSVVIQHRPLSTSKTPLSAQPIPGEAIKEAITKPEEADPHPIVAYQPPTTGFLSKLPSSWVPYAELLRLDKPTGTYYLYFPCLFSTLMAAPLLTPMATPAAVVGTSLLFFSGALIMRGAGCAINDLWDRNLDPHVRRTRLRPIARGAISPTSALVFTGGNLLAGLAVLLQFPFECFYYAVPSLALVAVYPLMKRVTNYPQAVLGLTFSWGAWMGWPALGLDLIDDNTALAAAGLLYASNISWTILYDMIYAHMDIKDDAKAGIKSIALAHDKDTKKVLSGLAVVQIGLLTAAGAVAGAGPAFFIASCGGSALTLTWMIRRVNLKSVRDCWWWFVNGCWITGGTIAAGLGVDYVIRYNGEEGKSKGFEAAKANEV